MSNPFSTPIVQTRCQPWERLWLAESRWVTQPDIDEDFFPAYFYGPAFEGLSGCQRPEFGPLQDFRSVPFLFLLGRPGSGKSYELKRAYECGWLDSPSELLEGKEFGSDVAATLDRLVLRSSGKPVRLIIDGLDEALLENPNFLPQLKRWFRGYLGSKGSPAIRLAMSCRWADWPVQSIADLASLWSDHDRLSIVLCPLRRSDVEESLQRRYGSDADSFWQQISDHHLNPVACWPQGLLGFMEEFDQSGRICESYSQAVEKQIEMHSRLTDSREDLARWQASISGGNWRRRVAGRAAAAMLWAGKNRLDHTVAADSSRTLTLADVQHSEEPWELGRRPVRIEDLEDLIQKSRLLRLLTSEMGWVFQSQVHQEALAAEWLLHQKLDEPRLRQLFGKEHEGQWRVQPQLGAVAAWLANKSAPFRNLVLKQDPLVLLRMDAATLPDEDRAAVVNGLLEATERIRVIEPAVRQAHLASLKHAKLPDQLEHWLRRSDVCDATKELVIEIAEATKLQAIAAVLWELYPHAGPRLQVEMAGGLAHLAIGPEHDSHWQAVLRGDLAIDLYGRLLGAALELQVGSGKVPVRDVLNWIIPGKHFSVRGSYQTVVRSLPDKLTLGDLPAVFEKLGGMPEIIHDSLEPPNFLHTAAIRLAISHFDQPEIAEILCDYWFKCLSRHVRPLSDASESRSDQDAGIWDEAHRRAFVRALIFHPDFETHSERRFFWGSENLLTVDDFDWSLHELLLAQSDDRWRWALVVTQSLWSVDLRGERGERLHQAWEQCPAIRAFLPNPLPGETLPEAMKRISERRQGEQEREDASRDEERRCREAEFQADLADETEACRRAHENGRLTWPDVMRILCARAHGPGESLITFDLISGIGSDDQWMMESAERYLREKRTVELSDGLTGLLALAACLPRIEADQELREVVGQHWLAAFLSDFSVCHLGEIPEGISWERFAALFPDAMPSACDMAIRDRYLHGGQLAELHSFRPCWSVNSSERLAAMLRETIQAPGFFRAMRFLSSESESLAVEVTRGWLTERLTHLSYDQRASLLGAALLLLNGRLATEIRESELVSDLHLVRDAISRAVHCLDTHRDLSDFSRWPDEAVRYLTEFCWRAFPRLERHRSSGRGFFKVTPEDEAIELRDRVTNEAAERGLFFDLPISSETDSPEEARDRIHRFDWLRNQASKARLRARRDVLEPRELFQLCSMPNARLARDKNELMDAVCESIQRWEESLVAGGWKHLWDLKPLRSREEDHIAVELREWLRKDLRVVSEREVKLTSSHRTDILVQNLTLVGEQLTVIVELKKVRKNNARERRTAMQSQLRDIYLRERLAEGWTHGLYVVAWTSDPGSKLDSEAAMDEECGRLIQQAAQLSEAPYVLRSLVIDARSRRNGG